MTSLLRCGIVGYGYMGEIRRRVIERLPQLELVGVCEPDARQRAKVQQCAVFDQFEPLLAHVDVMFVCTPNAYAPQYCVQSLNAGRHVFCEKPPGRGLEDVRAIRAAERPTTKLMFGFNHRYHPGIIRAKALVEDGRFGEIVSLRGIYGKSGGLSFPNSWRNDKAMSGGGILLDQGIHMLDLFRFFCGDFSRVKCFTSDCFWKFAVEDNAFVLLQNERKQCAMLHSSATLWRHTFKLDIILERGYLTVEGLLSKTGSYGREKLIVVKRQFEDEATALGNPPEEIIYFDQDLSWDLEVEEFVRCITEERPVTMSSSHDALQVMELISAAYVDADTGVVPQSAGRAVL